MVGLFHFLQGHMGWERFIYKIRGEVAFKKITTHKFSCDMYDNGKASVSLNIYEGCSENMYINCQCRCHWDKE